MASIRARMPGLQTLLENESPDFVCLQEIKVEEDKFPYFELKSLGYNAVISGQKSWNGVAVLAKESISLKCTALAGFEDQARFVEALAPDGTSVISVYVPNGQAPANNPEDTSRLEYKLKWFAALAAYLKDKKNYIICGDFNVILKDKDVYNPKLFEQSALFVPPVREAFASILSQGMLNPLRQLADQSSEPFYSFWDFQGGAWPRNHGIFLDYILLSTDFKKRLAGAKVLKEYRGMEKASDHVPVEVDIK